MTGSDPETGDRVYLKITPTADQLDPQTITGQFRRLQQLDVSNHSKSWLSRLVRSTPEPPIIEWLLVSDGTMTGSLSYCVSINDPSLLGTLEKICRGMFPRTYEIERLHTHLLADFPGVSVEEDEPVVAMDTEESDPGIAAVTFLGKARRRRDWQTQLTPFDTFIRHDETRLPLSSIVETLAESTVPMVYQALLRPKSEWTDDVVNRRIDLEQGTDTPASIIVQSIFNSQDDPHDTEPIGAAAERIEEIENRDAQRSFVVNARVLGIEPASEDESDTDSGIDLESRPSIDVESELSDLTTAFAQLSGTFHHVEGKLSTGSDARDVLEDILNRKPAAQNYDRLYTKLPVVANRSAGIVADITEIPGFCLLDGTALSAIGERGLAPTPDERSSVTRPPEELLSPYRTDGFALGRPLDHDHATTTEHLALPPSLQPLHLAWFGKTGSGKSTSLVTAILENQAATVGADILIDPKGDGMVEEYLRAHYAKHGSLDDVYYFDCTETLPAISFFDIRKQLESGIHRTTAVQDVVDHYIEILTGIMGRERFERAVRSPDIIRYLCKALFDPIHGDDAFAHNDLQNAASQLQDSRDPPPVTDDTLQGMLNGLTSNSNRSFDELMQGVANRIEKIPLDPRLGALFNYVPNDGGPHFDVREILDEDAVVLIDTGGLRPESKRALTLVVLSQLWTALRRRKHHHGSNAVLPLVNLYLEEAAEIADSTLLSTLLAQSRSFGLSMTLAMQFPGQLAQSDYNVYSELLNNVSTIVTGNVAVDSRLPKRLATADMPPADVQRRLGALSRGEWMVTLPAEFGNPEPRPFLLESLPLPAGHPESDAPLTTPRETAFEAAMDGVARQTLEDVAIPLSAIETPLPVSTSDQHSEVADRTDTTLPYTTRLPDPVDYAHRSHTLQCVECESRYDPTTEGMRHAITCCHDLDAIDRADVPPCELRLNLTENEYKRSPYSLSQLRFLKAVVDAHQQRFDPELEFDILQDSMIRLQEYVGIDDMAVQDLIDADLIRIDCTLPHKLYTVTADGREAINATYRRGITHGHGKGDLGESTLHVAMVELGRRYLEHAFVDDPDSPVESTATYHDLPEGNGRLDAVGLDTDGEIVATLEAERSNHDIRRAVPSDFDKMAACDPDHAIWLVKNRGGATDVLEALNDPLEGRPRIDKTYSQNTPPSDYKYDAPGLTEMQTFQALRTIVLAE